MPCVTNFQPSASTRFGITFAIIGSAIPGFVSITYCLLPTLKRRLKNAGVDRFVRADDHASDHATVWVELSDGDVLKRSAVKRGTHTRVRRCSGED